MTPNEEAQRIGELLLERQRLRRRLALQREEYEKQVGQLLQAYHGLVEVTRTPHSYPSHENTLALAILDDMIRTGSLKSLREMAIDLGKQIDRDREIGGILADAGISS